MNEIQQTNLYEKDFLEWIDSTATLLKEKRFDLLDLENLIKEIEAMGRSEKNEAMNRLTTIIEHLLKLIYWESEKDYNSRVWKQTVATQKRELIRLLETSPSLKTYLKENWVKCYQEAVKSFGYVSGIRLDFEPIFSLEEILEEDFFGSLN